MLGKNKLPKLKTITIDRALKFTRDELLQYPNNTIDCVLWRVFATWVKKRDWENGCITCNNKYMEGANAHAGHYIKRGYNQVKYDPHNVHLQCARCNGYGKGEVTRYRKAIVKMYGEEEAQRLDLIDNGRNVYKFSKEELLDMFDYYKSKLEE